MIHDAEFQVIFISLWILLLQISKSSTLYSFVKKRMINWIFLHVHVLLCAYSVILPFFHSRLSAVFSSVSIFSEGLFGDGHFSFICKKSCSVQDFYSKSVQSKSSILGSGEIRKTMEYEPWTERKNKPRNKTWII